MAVAFEQRGKLDQARKHYQRVPKSDPELALHGKFALGELDREKDRDAAMKHYRSVAAGPADPEENALLPFALYRLAELERAAGDEEAASKAVARIHDLLEEHSDWPEADALRAVVEEVVE